MNHRVIVGTHEPNPLVGRIPDGPCPIREIREIRGEDAFNCSFSLLALIVELCSNIGRHMSRKTAEEGWGQGTVEALADAIRRRHPTTN